MPLSDKLRRAARKPTPAGRSPLWQGPCGAGPQGGVTQGLLSRYLSCRERFRVLTMEGLRPAETFRPPVEYGCLWHAAEEDLAAGWVPGHTLEKLTAYAVALGRRYPFQREQVAHWYSLAQAQFPRYADYWAKHPDVLARTPLLQEQVFDVPYRLPSGRAVRLRGKWDSVDLVGDGVWLVENKTKSRIDGQKINRQLTFDLQTMLYLVALVEKREDLRRTFRATVGGYKGERERDIIATSSILGVRYNVVRRSAHKSAESMCKKIDKDVAAAAGGEWFARWNVTVTPADVARFRRQCLDPVLENLCDDYEWWAECLVKHGDPFDQFTRRPKEFPAHRARHYRTPYFYDPLAEGGSGDLDQYLDTGSTVGLVTADTLFPELEAA